MSSSLFSNARRLLNFWGQAENVFLTFAALFGVAFIMASAPFQAADEYQHFKRAYVISKGQVLAPEGRMPKSLYDFMAITEGVPFHSEKRIPAKSVLSFLTTPVNNAIEISIVYPNVMTYSAIPYFPQALGCLVGRSLALPPAAAFYLARLFNLSFWMVLCYLALKITPIYKWVFLAFMLMPMSLFQAASVSADAFSNAFAFVLIAVCLHLSFNETDQMAKFDYLLLIVLITLLALSKPPYALLASFALIIPARKYSSRKQQLLFLAVFFLVTLSITLLSVSNGAKVNYSSTQQNADIRPGEQALFIITHPKSALVVLYNTLELYSFHLWKSYIGILGWVDTQLKKWIYQTYLAFLILVCLFDNRKDIRIQVWQKWVSFLCSIGMFVAVLMALYIIWTHYQAAQIDGAQGRYFIPVIPTLTLMLYNNQFKWHKISMALVLIYIPAVLISTVHTLILRYYQF